MAETICLPAFVFETYRAVSGNTLSWAYVFEWPLLGGYAVYVWRKLLQDEDDERHGRVAASATIDVHDEETAAQLEAWNAYLAKVHGDDEPPERE